MVSNKKGISLADMYPAVLIIILVGILLGVGIYAMITISQSIVPAQAVANETVTPTTAGTAVATATDCAFNTFAVTLVTNASGGEIIASGNYSTDATAGTIRNITALYGADDWNVTYTYLGGEGIGYCTALETSTTGIGTFANWIAVIVVVIAAAIVLGIVMRSFSKNNAV